MRTGLVEFRQVESDEDTAQAGALIREYLDWLDERIRRTYGLEFDVDAIPPPRSQLDEMDLVTLRVDDHRSLSRLRRLRVAQYMLRTECGDRIEHLPER